MTTYERVAPEAFHRRVRELSALEHPNIPRLLDHGVVSAGPKGSELAYTVETLVGGRSLDRPAPERIGFAAALGTFREACRIVSQIHAAGALAGIRLRPDNIVVGPEGLFLTDYNTVSPPNPAGGGSEEGMVAEAIWLSPEEMTGASPGPSVDQYNLGSLGYFLCTGRAPFFGRSVMGLCIAILTETPVDPRELCPELPKEVSWALLRALRKQPEERFATVDDLLAALGG